MKKEQDVCILAHAYQGQEILEVADYMGDPAVLPLDIRLSDWQATLSSPGLKPYRSLP